MKKKLGVIQVLAILIIGIMIGAFAERSHVFGYSDNTPIIPTGTYKTTNVGNYKKIIVTRDTVKDAKGTETVIIENRFTNRTHGRLVLATLKNGNRSLSYYVVKIKEGWQVSPIVNGKPAHTSSFIIYSN
ncbi:hypothetical protein [Weissella paramesenteroides]|jgi:hypothetical protein|uniref:hypothetical protein n=1 Tax=Weissella paramesenteroides TaxID=1249 RepID=UPI0013DBDA89|nr:hypothetical protein [Weissella paramesenteroides]NEZ88697.1 hypothetical protein [Weissella paramesenteroides]NFB03023.1 hypothetical protein [Weissella paramesenteroides]